ncbi:MAG: hypothetical protein LDL30_05665 [Desulfovibrio sp.]|nr:hypothetical protein [Desulfovibrio sp.]MCA1985146.1 hypothetical protein [Desulfovibrio sp.]
MPWTQAQQWEAISQLSSISNSLASQIQRELATQFSKLHTLGLASTDLPQAVDVTPLIESDTGRLARYMA